MSHEHSFVTYLQTLVEDRAALAALRRGLGQQPGTVPDMYRYVVHYLPETAYPGSWTEQAYYLLATLYALHPESSSGGNLGAHFAQTLSRNAEQNTAVERRFTVLLTAHPDDLHFHLRQAISFLRSKDVAVNWHQLMWDVLQWRHTERATIVKKRWASQFWRRRKSEQTEDAS